jgi:hypothetical protein|tara:strand:+ start:63 stop:314 length:252 start_codon:yes stop_codon:yes gene_type:complete
MTPAAAKKYKPRRTPGSLDEVVYSDTKKAAMDEAKAMKETEDATNAYNKSLTTENKASGGSVGSASKRADGIASRGKTNCKIC